MRRSALIFGSLALVAIGLACSKDFEEQRIAGEGGLPEEDSGPTTIPPIADTGVQDQPAGTGLGTGLPCDVQAVLEDRCIACHSNSSPPPLLTYSDLVAPSITDTKK